KPSGSSISAMTRRRKSAEASERVRLLGGSWLWRRPMTDFAAERERMIDRTIARRGLSDPALIAAFRAVPREAFVSADLAAHAYADGPLPIESGQTISQPYIVALSIDAAKIAPDSKVLEIG